MKDLLNKLDEPTRRQFMINAARTYLGVNLFPMLSSSIASAAPEIVSSANKAKHVIYLYMAGGMSHVDTFDPKPKNKEIMGATEVISTNVDHIQFGSHLKDTAKIADKLCIINSMNSTQGAHEQGQYMMHTSYDMRGSIVHPALGSWVVKLGGRINPSIPGFVSINSSPKTSNGGFFGAKYSAAPIGRPADGLKDSTRPFHVSEESFDRRLKLADHLNSQFYKRYANVDVQSYDELYKEAVELMKSKDLVAFDLKKEEQAVRDAYGDGSFGQGCLLARRLVEHGVRFIEVGYGSWDTHANHFDSIEKLCTEFDKAYSALILDLEKRNLLKDTLVVVATEFGRTPDIDPLSNTGRHHFPGAFSCVLAGGGVKGGIKYGETDKSASKIVSDPVTVQDFNATIAYSLGLPHDLVIMSPTKRPFKIADKGVPVTSIFA